MSELYDLDSAGRDFFWGLIATLIYAFASFIMPLLLPLSSALFSLGIPQSSGFVYTLSTVSIFNFLTVVIIAPIAEELFFGYFITSLFGEELEWNPLIVILFNALIFSIFHFFVFTQGGFSAVTSPFIGAFVFRIASDLLIKSTENLLTGTIFHSGVNLLLSIKNSVGI